MNGLLQPTWALVRIFCLCCPHFSLLNFDEFSPLSLRHWSEFGESSSFQRYPTSGDCPIHAISFLLNRPLNPESIVSVSEHDALRLFWAIFLYQIMPWSRVIVGKVICATTKSTFSQNGPLATQVHYCQRMTGIITHDFVQPDFIKPFLDTRVLRTMRLTRIVLPSFPHIFSVLFDLIDVIDTKQRQRW